MKNKILMAIMFLTTMIIVMSSSGASIIDDFNRADNTNISTGFVTSSGVTWGEVDDAGGVTIANKSIRIDCNSGNAYAFINLTEEPENLSNGIVQVLFKAKMYLTGVGGFNGLANSYAGFHVGNAKSGYSSTPTGLIDASMSIYGNNAEQYGDLYYWSNSPSSGWKLFNTSTSLSANNTDERAWTWFNYTLNQGLDTVEYTAYTSDVLGNIDSVIFKNDNLTKSNIDTNYFSFGVTSGCNYGSFAVRNLSITEAVTVTDVEVDWDNLQPLNDTGVNGNFTMQYNVSVIGTTVQNCSLYTNGVINQTNTSINIGVNQFYIEVGGSETLTAYVDCYSSDEDYNTTSTKLIEVDIISPDVTINTPNKAYVQDVTLDFQATDTEGNLFAYEINITSSNGSTMFYQNDSNLGLASYNYTHILDLVNFTDGIYTITVNISDSHTKNVIKDYKPKVDNVNKKIEYETDSGIVGIKLNKLEFYNVGDLITPAKKNKKNSVNKIITEKIKDKKYKFSFETDLQGGESGMIYAFDILIDNPNVRKVKTSSYNAHYVIGEGIGANWFDCESTSIIKTEERIEGGLTYIKLFSDTPLLECQSIGGLNFDGAVSNFNVTTCGGWICNQYSSCNTSDQRACTNVTGVPTEFCNNTVYVSEGGDYGGLEGSCDYCTEDLQTSVSNSTCTGGDLEQTTLYWDNNYATCCAVTNITTDCSIINGSYVNGTNTISCSNYEYSYTAEDLPLIVVDGVGTAGASFIGWIPMLIIGVVGVIGVIWYRKIRLKYVKR